MASANPLANNTWNVVRIDQPTTTAPGQTATYTFTVTAPSTPGTYNFQWKMVQDQIEWFGAESPNLTIQVAAQGDTVTYIHTDALGSPVARSDSAGNVISRTSYEPYGRTASGLTPTIGFTGHVNDADTGLVYMQQRYYDPVAGRFLSVDPVTTDASTGSSFNRYAYANNSPYKYVDPDGRFVFLIPLIPYVATATVAVVGHYVLPGRQGREDTARAVGNAILSGASNTGEKSNESKAPVPDATGGEKTNTGTRIWDKPGDFQDANRDFDNKNPTNVEDKGNGVRVGTLDEGKRIIVRPTSSDGRPTVEIQRPDGKRSEDKVRYGEKD